jgi:hypothetical protein
MARSASGRYASGGEEAFDWLSRTLGAILGGGPAHSLLRRDRSLREAGSSEIAGLAQQIERRLPRREDPRSGRISYALAGPAVDIATGIVRSEDLAIRARFAMPAVRQTLDEIDPEICRPGVCADDVRELLAHIRMTIDALDAELAGEAVAELVDHWFEELLADYGAETAGDPEVMRGLFAVLRRYLEIGADGVSGSVEDERQIQLIDVAADTLGCLRMAWDDISGPQGAGTLSDRFGRVAHCAAAIADQAVRLRAVLADSGISTCELESVVIGRGATSSGMHAREVTLGGVISILEQEPIRIQRLARLGGRVQMMVIGGAARRMHALAGQLDGAGIAKRFGLAGDDAEAIAMEVDRLRSLVGAFAGDHGSPGGYGGAGRSSGPGGTSGGSGPSKRATRKQSAATSGDDLTDIPSV